MRYLTPWLFGLWLFVQPAIGQTLTFPDFVRSLASKKDIPVSNYDVYLGLRLETNVDFRRTMEVLFQEDRFVAILITEEATDHTEQSGTLTTYGWEGHPIDRLEYAYAIVGDFYSRTAVCTYAGLEITCTKRTIESTLQEVHDENGAIMGMQPMTVKDENVEERYRLTADGRFEPLVEGGLQPSIWIRLTEVNGKWVIYHYCFAGMATIELSRAASGGMELVVFSGQDSDIYDVLEIRHEGDVSILRIKMRHSETSTEREVTFRYLDDAGRVAEWDGLYENATRAVLSAFENEMPVVYERDGECGEP